MTSIILFCIFVEVHFFLRMLETAVSVTASWTLGICIYFFRNLDLWEGGLLGTDWRNETLAIRVKNKINVNLKFKLI